MTCRCSDKGVTQITPCAGSTAPGGDTTAPGRCSCENCQCQTGDEAFYLNSPAVQECHVKKEIHQTFTTAALCATTFNMPACDESVSVLFPEIQRMLAGSYLWNADVGYLRVSSFDTVTNTAVVVNDCNVGNAAPGTLIPSCTLFDVVDPPYTPESRCGTESVFLTASFVAPAVGAAVSISVSSLVGLVVGELVQVVTGVYTLSGITGPNTISINNGGSGITAGTTVEPYDALGNCITPITPYNTAPCNAQAVSAGALIVCDDTGTPKPLNATAMYQVPMVTDPNDNTVEFRDIAVEAPVCTPLTACVNLANNIEVYAVFVVSTAAFSVGDLVYISGSGNTTVDVTYFEVTAIPSLIELDITTVEDPNTVVANGLTGNICKAPCCVTNAWNISKLEDRLDDPCDEDWSGSQTVDVQHDMTNPPETGTIAAGATFTSVAKSITITNSTCNQMLVEIDCDFDIVGTFDANEGGRARTTFQPLIGITTAVLPNAPAAPAPASMKDLKSDQVFGPHGGGAGTAYQAQGYHTYHYKYAVLLAANSVIRVDAQLVFDYGAYQPPTAGTCCATPGNDGSGDFTITRAAIDLFGTGVVVQAA